MRAGLILEGTLPYLVSYTYACQQIPITLPIWNLSINHATLQRTGLGSPLIGALHHTTQPHTVPHSPTSHHTAPVRAPCSSINFPGAQCSGLHNYRAVHAYDVNLFGK